MANQEHLDILKQGVEIWNQWRKEYPDIYPDLSSADLSGASLINANLTRAYLTEGDLSRASLINANLTRAYLGHANLRGANLTRAYLGHANLRGARLSYTNLTEADLTEANLGGANFTEADLSDAILSGTNLKGANLTRASLTRASLTRADLSNANLTGATLVRTNLAEATLTDCNIYGVSAWGVELKGATQNNLVITPYEEPTITVDNLKIAQFIYLLLNNAEIRDVIDTITSKAVLILGRFTTERKIVLDALREALRRHGYLPILFDFEKPANRDITETVSTLAHMARFVVADITDAKSIPQELSMIVPNLPSVPVQPLILTSQEEYGMFEHFTKFPWVLPVYRYTDEASLLQSFQESVIEPAEQKAEELAKR